MLTIASWNVAGASLLKTPISKRKEKQQKYNKQLHKFIEQTDPDIVLLQEVIKYCVDKKCQYIFDIPKQYYLTMHAAIDTKFHCYPPKWGKIKQAGEWPDNTYLSHGLGILWKKDLKHSSIWNLDSKKAVQSADLNYEVVRLENGLFTGSRNTEPRLAMIAQFHYQQTDFFIVNVHLTTLKGEREGFLERDKQGSNIRQQQIEIISEGIISRLNHDRNHRINQKSKKNHPTIWILAGDFNAGPDSLEVTNIQQMNLTQLCDNKATKRAKNAKTASIKVDYIFAGSTYFDPKHSTINKIFENVKSSYQVIDEIKISDHHPILVNFPDKL
ncbi:MAG: endonuclease/exonuclease/phosphatase family protein [Gammaproteobacteria bacterium]|nr:endonuclease/exonuclease/phosphatase family protein [Gammaproteobacteria bacterium]